jgi:hypothetical protein
MVTLELVLGSIGTGLGIMLTALKIKEYWDNKPKISLDVKVAETGSIEHRENYESIGLRIECDIMNNGNRPTTIREVYLSSVNLKGHILYPENRSCYDIEAGKSINIKLSFKIDDKDLIERLRYLYDRHKQLLFHVNILDTRDKRVRKEIIIFGDKTFGVINEKPKYPDEIR